MVHEKKQPIILVIDDEPAILSSVANILEDEGCRVTTTSNPDDISHLIGALIPDLVFLDIFIPNSNGLDLLSQIKREYPAQKVIIFSGFGNIPLAVDALKRGALDFIEKPFSEEEITNKVKYHCLGSEKNQESISRDYGYGESGIVGESYLFKELMNYAEMIIPLKNHVMIQGPRGIGKTLLAQYMHKKKNPNHALLIINGQLTNNIDSDLSILQDQRSLIIKNIDALSLENQRKLYLFSHNQNIRIFGLTNKSLFSLVQKKLFDEDLFYTLNSTPIEIPSLNKRRFDIPLLINFFINKINVEKNTHYSCDTDVIRILRNYEWKENCKELYNVLYLSTMQLQKIQSVITVDVIKKFLTQNHCEVLEEQHFQYFASFYDATESFQKKFLLYQLKKNRYDLDQVCNVLSMNAAQLKNELERLDISLGV